MQVDGLNGAGSAPAGVPVGEGNLAAAAVSAALRYRAQAPLVDGLMKELGLDGASLGGLAPTVAPATLIAEPTEG